MNRQAVRVLGGGIGVFILTGGVMTFQRLAEPQTNLAYVIVLVLKIVVSVTAFALVWTRGELFAGLSAGPVRRLLPRPFRSQGGVAILLGSVAYLLAIVLQRIVEARADRSLSPKSNRFLRIAAHRGRSEPAYNFRAVAGDVLRLERDWISLLGRANPGTGIVPRRFATPAHYRSRHPGVGRLPDLGRHPGRVRLLLHCQRGPQRPGGR